MKFVHIPLTFENTVLASFNKFFVSVERGAMPLYLNNTELGIEVIFIVDNEVEPGDLIEQFIFTVVAEDNQNFDLDVDDKYFASFQNEKPYHVFIKN